MLPNHPVRLPLLTILLAPLLGCQPPPAARVQSINTDFLRDYAETRGFSAGQPAGIELTPTGDAAIFLRSGPRDVIRNLYEMNTATGEVHGLARADDILKGVAENLSPEEKARRERIRESAHGITWYRLSDDGRRVLIGLSGKLYLVNRADGRVAQLPENKAGPAMDAQFSPDGRFVSCVRNHDLYVTDLDTMQEHAVTTGGTDDISHAEAEFVAQEEMDRRGGYWWSGDSRQIAFEECDQREVEKLYIADPAHPEAAAQGWRYPRAGKANAKVRLGIVSAGGGTPTWVEWDRDKYPYMAAVQWGKDGPLSAYVLSRDQRDGVLYRVDPRTGKTTELLRDADAAWLNLQSDMPRWFAGGTKFLWMTERSGDWELEVHAADGAKLKTVALGTNRLYDVVAVDQARGEAVVAAGDDPTQTHLLRVGIESGEIVALTDGKGSHGGKFSKDGNVWVENASLADGTSRHVIRGRDATLRREIPAVAEDPPFAANVELTTVEAGGRTMHAAIIRPRNFNRSRRYPVIVSVYGGPHSLMVSSASRGYLRSQWIADQGFIIVSLDGRGTPRRGRAWERATSWNLIDAPLEDQAAGVQALGARYKEMDLSRVGIYGWSFGGYFSAMAVLKRPDVFHCGVAGAPVIDWQDYDTCYTERYMGRPQDNPKGYETCSALTYADQLQRPLLLIHGTTDDNVYFTHTLKMSDALFKAGRPYEVLVLAGFTHMVPDPTVTTRLYERIVRFFMKHLVESPASAPPPRPRPGG